mmetsp:Transcript_16325/g.41503  ORF Transcript_16325/g.41503 Transcript_16325/m.41503 type:complete len:340 (-) Transcript_16325:209-1228(-)
MPMPTCSGKPGQEEQQNGSHAGEDGVVEAVRLVEGARDGRLLARRRRGSHQLQLRVALAEPVRVGRPGPRALQHQLHLPVRHLPAAQRPLHLRPALPVRAEQHHPPLAAAKVACELRPAAPVHRGGRRAAQHIAHRRVGAALRASAQPRDRRLLRRLAVAHQLHHARIPLFIHLESDAERARHAHADQRAGGRQHPLERIRLGLARAHRSHLRRELDPALRVICARAVDVYLRILDQERLVAHRRPDVVAPVVLPGLILRSTLGVVGRRLCLGPRRRARASPPLAAPHEDHRRSWDQNGAAVQADGARSGTGGGAWRPHCHRPRRSSDRNGEKARAPWR